MYKGRIPETFKEHSLNIQKSINHYMHVRKLSEPETPKRIRVNNQWTSYRAINSAYSFTRAREKNIISRALGRGCRGFDLSSEEELVLVPPNKA